MATLVIQGLNTLSLALILSLVGLGLAVIFGVMGIVNLAHGEFFMLGAYLVVGTTSLGGNVWLGLVVAPIAVGLLAFVLEECVIRFLYRRPIDSVLATWGLSIVIRQVVEIVAGKDFKNVPNPLPGAVSVFGTGYPSYRLVVMAAAVVLLALAYWAIARTPVGLWVRAAMDNPEMALAVGINTRLLHRLTFAVGAMLAAVAGALMAPLVSIVPHMGLNYIVDAFLVVIIGGLSSLAGVITGGAMIGGIEGVSQYLTDPVIARVLVLSMAIVVIRVRPSGLHR